MSDLYQILMETEQLLQAEKDVSMTTQMKDILVHQPLFETYIEGLATGLEQEDRDMFMGFARQTQRTLMETSSIYGFNPYASFVMPILRKFWPAMSIKEAITTSPMDQPVAVRYFLEPFAKTYNDVEVPLPDYNNNVSDGPQIPLTANVAVPSETDLLAFVSLNSDVAGISKYFRIVKVSDGTTTVDVAIEPDENGNFSQAVTIGSNTDIIQGHIDRESGILSISSTNGTATQINVDTLASLEKNTINTHIEFRPKKLLFEATIRKLSASWSVEYEQDVQNLFNIKAQSEFVDIMSNQIATEIDREIISDLLGVVTFSHPTAIDTFSKTIPAGYALGTKSWYENIIPKLNDLSQAVHNDTNLGRANYIIMNPSEAAVLESTAKYQYISDQYGAGTEQTFSVGSLESGKWKTIVTPIMPKGKMLLIYKSTNEQKAVYYYCPYIPVTLYPFPLGTMPSMSLATRYAKRAVRPKGIALLNVTA